MSHEIMGQRFIARSRPAWHNIAKRIFGETDRISASEAMKEVAGDIEVIRSPVWYELNDQKERAADQFAIVRKPTVDDPAPKLLGITSAAWTMATYPQLAAALDGLSGKYPVETAGLLNEGGLAFLCFRGEGWDVRGDEMRSYLAANFSLTPGVGHRFFHSAIRVVCWNTNQAANREASINLSIPHATDALQRIELAAKLVESFAEMKDKAKSIYEAFADKHISQKDADSIFDAAFRMPDLPPRLRLLKQQLTDTEAEVFKRALTADLLAGLERAQESYDKDCAKTLQFREAARDRYEAFDPPRLRGTVWAAFNAATEVSDWREGRNADYSALFGSRAQEKSRAWAAGMALVK